MAATVHCARCGRPEAPAMTRTPLRGKQGQEIRDSAVGVAGTSRPPAVFVMANGAGTVWGWSVAPGGSKPADTGAP